MRKLFILTIVVLALIALRQWFFISKLGQIDHCLDSGGHWDDMRAACSYKPEL